MEKGHTNNPNGRPPKRLSYTHLLEQLGNEKTVLSEEGRIAYKRGLALKLWKMALEGNLEAIKEIYNRIDGRAIERIITKDDNLGTILESFAGELLNDDREDRADSESKTEESPEI